MSLRVTRRDVLRALSLSGAGAVAAPAWADTLTALVQEEHVHPPSPPPAADWTPKVLDAHQNESVIALSEAILPATDTPGAKAALVNRFFDALLDDADEHERRDFLRGLEWVDSRCQELFGTDFISSTPEQQTALLTIVSSGKNHTAEDQIGVEFFRTLKSWTLTGYYTSEVGLRQELDDDGQMFFTEFKGCAHPEHGATAPKPGARPGKRG